MKSTLEGEAISTNSKISLFVSESGTLIPLGYLPHHLESSVFHSLGPPLRAQPTSFLAFNDSSSPGIFLPFVHKSPRQTFLQVRCFFNLTTFTLILFICEDTANTGTGNSWTSTHFLRALCSNLSILLLTRELKCTKNSTAIRKRPLASKMHPNPS